MLLISPPGWYMIANFEALVFIKSLSNQNQRLVLSAGRTMNLGNARLPCVILSPPQSNSSTIWLRSCSRLPKEQFPLVAPVIPSRDIPIKAHWSEDLFV